MKKTVLAMIIPVAIGLSGCDSVAGLLGVSAGVGAKDTRSKDQTVGGEDSTTISNSQQLSNKLSGEAIIASSIVRVTAGETAKDMRVKATLARAAGKPMYTVQEAESIGPSWIEGIDDGGIKIAAQKALDAKDYDQLANVMTVAGYAAIGIRPLIKWDFRLPQLPAVHFSRSQYTEDDLRRAGVKLPAKEKLFSAYVGALKVATCTTSRAGSLIAGSPKFKNVVFNDLESPWRMGEEAAEEVVTKKAAEILRVCEKKYSTPGYSIPGDTSKGPEFLSSDAHFVFSAEGAQVMQDKKQMLGNGFYEGRQFDVAIAKSVDISNVEKDGWSISRGRASESSRSGQGKI